MDLNNPHFRMLRGEFERTLANHAPKKHRELKEQGKLEVEVTRRAKLLWPSVETRLRMGMTFTEAVMQLASDIYPPEAET